LNLKDKNLYYVGGVVRDENLGVASLDVDYCYEGDAIKFAKESGLQILRENPDFGTVRVFYGGKDIDIASTRTEKYPQKGHLPVVDKIGCSLKEDLMRRDFTINAMAKNTVTGEIVDYFNGSQDLCNKQIRVLHDASFIDDPSRILRGLKFAIRFDFELSPETRALQEDYLNNINYNQSYHRLKKELKETFNLNNNKVYKKFVEYGIYKLLGENVECFDSEINIESLVNEFSPKNVWLVYIGHLDLRNFEMTSEELKIVEDFERIRDCDIKDDYDLFCQFQNASLESILLYAIHVDLNKALYYLRELSNVKLNINGEDLKKLGIQQGKIYKEVFDKVLFSKITNKYLTREDELKIAKEYYFGTKNIK